MPQITEISLSADGQEILKISEEFAAAYFSGDIDAVQNYMTVSYILDMDVYTGIGTVDQITLKGLTNIDEEEIGSVKVVSLEYTDSDFEEMLLYLTLEFI